MKQNKTKDFIEKPPAMIPCPSCKKQISREAPTCPKCGKEISMEDIEKADKQNAQVKTGCFGCLGIIIIFFAVSIIGGIFGTSDSSSAQPELSGLNELESKIEKVAAKKLGERLFKLNTIQQVAGGDEGGYLLDVEYLASENLTKGMMRSSIIMDAQDFIESMSENPEFNEVKIYMLKPHLELVDQYGNPSDDQVAKIVFRKADADRINWSNMYSEQFEKLIKANGDLWWHPALRDQ